MKKISEKKEQQEEKICSECGFILNRIHFTSIMTEEWTYNGQTWEQTAHHSLVTDNEQEVYCPECSAIVGKGIDFGF